MTLQLNHPFTCIVAGPSGSGKTVFTTRLIENAKVLIEPAPDRILWCYGIYQTFFSDVKNVEFHEGLPNLDNFDGKQRTLLILDDLMHETDDSLANIYTSVIIKMFLYSTLPKTYFTVRNRTAP